MRLLFCLDRAVVSRLRRIHFVLVFVLFIPLGLLAQIETITGSVKDETGVAIENVSVMIKGETGGTKTDAKGRYSIAANPGQTIVFSSVNYESYELKIGTLTAYDVILTPLNKSMDEIVVLGYNIGVKRKDLTGSVGSVDMKDAMKAPVPSFDGFLAGRVAGVSVQSSDGQPGSNANITIRGTGSVNTDNAPLYVVDGFPLENGTFNSINPDDIESIDVLKDASSTALYGARGSNGVIVITTKRGKNAKPQLSYNGYIGLQKAPEKVKMMEAYEFVRYVHDINPAFDSIFLRPGVDINEYKTAPSINMQDFVFQNGNNQNHDVSLRGGNESTKYSLSGNYNSNEGSIIYTGFKRYQGRFVLDQNLGKLKMGINTNYSYSESYGASISTPQFYASSTNLYSIWGWRPAVPINSPYDSIPLDALYDPINDIQNNQDYRVNPIVALPNIYSKKKNTTFVANGYAEYAFTKQLKLRISGGITRTIDESENFNNSKTPSASKWYSNGVNGGRSNTPISNWLNDNILTYATNFGTDHHLSALADISFTGNRNTYYSIYASQLPNEQLGLDGLDSAPATNITISTYSSRWNFASGLARVNYDYKSKYIFTASVRADGSSKFAAGNKWGYFPSAAAAWRISNEKFMESLTFISDAKFRFSYGESGNNRVSDFAYLPSIGFDNPYWFFNTVNNAPASLGAYILSPGNLDLVWETNKQTNLGLDLAFLKSRIMLTADVYKRVTDNLLLFAALPYANGIFAGGGFKNVGKMENKGLEITLITKNIQGKVFEWGSNFNISFNRNKVLRLADGTGSLLSGNGTFFNTTFQGLYPYISVVGKPLGQMYGLEFDGVYQFSDFDLLPNGTYFLKPNITNNSTNNRNTVKPGDIKYKDLNGDLVINNSDYTIIGSGAPQFEGGFSNNFRYKGFDLNVFLQYKYGFDVINANRYIFEGGIVANNPFLNQYDSYKDRWTPTNPSNTLFRAGGMINAAYSNRVIEDGSYLKLRTISLGYNFSSTLLNRIKISNLRVYASAQNLITWTKYSGLDPEVSSRQSNLTPNFDYTGYPHSLSAVLGLNVTF